MRCIFLDIDGCLRHFNEKLEAYFLSERNISALKTVIDAVPDVKIIWSTNWRFCDESVSYSGIKNPKIELERLSWIRDRVVGNTPCKMSSEHFHEIKWWLDSHPDVTRYAVIDDCYFPEKWFGIEKHVVRCEYGIGLTEQLGCDVIRILTDKT